MNSRLIVIAALVAFAGLAACSSGSGYGGSGYGAAYDAGGGAAPSAASSGSSHSDSVRADIHAVVHDEKQNARIFKAEKTEPLLDTSGFKSLPIDTPAKHKVIGGLQPLTFNRLGHHGKIRYWFPDPYYCNCVYVGDEQAYLRYKQAKKDRKKERQEEMYLVDQENLVNGPIDSEWDPVTAFGMP